MSHGPRLLNDPIDDPKLQTQYAYPTPWTARHWSCRWRWIIQPHWLMLTRHKHAQLLFPRGRGRH